MKTAGRHSPLPGSTNPLSVWRLVKKNNTLNIFFNTHNMNILDAIKQRHSVRSYADRPVEKEKLDALQAMVDDFNQQGGLHIQLVTNDPSAFDSRMAHYGKFSGISNYLAMIGPKGDDLDEKLGYYGERLVLEAQMMGLNTCWVGLTFKKNPDVLQIAEGEKLRCVIPFGYGETQGNPHKIKSAEQVSNVSDLTPAWFRQGVEAALLAPTAVNQQKFFFQFAPASNGKPARVSAKRSFSVVGFTQIDLGIAKCHFELGAGKQNFEWL